MKQLYLWLCAGLMVASCTHSDLGNEQQGGSGPVSRVAFSAAVRPQYTVNYSSAEDEAVDLDQIQWPATADFTLDILSGNSVLQSHPAQEIPSELELYVGEYSLRAHSGSHTEAWNVPYMEGTQDFSLSSSSTAFNAQLNCTIKSTLVYLVFDQNFATVFSNYTALLNTEHTKEAWVWSAGEKRVACMRPTNELLIRVDATMRSNGATYNYGINPLVDLAAGELNVVHFSMVGGEVTATISSDNGVNVTRKTVQLEPDWLATRKTSISGTFDQSSTLQNIYGLPYTTPTDVVVRSNVGLKSLKIKASGALSALLGATEVDLNEANQVQAKTGLVVTKSQGAMAYDGRLNFKECFNTLPVLDGSASQYLFTIEAVDLLGQTQTFDTKINISLPELGTRTVDPTKVWNRYAKVPGAVVSDARVPEAYREKFVFQYVIRQGDGDWEPLGEHQGSGDIYKNGLQPATTYTTAVVLSGNYVAQASFTTDTEPQIPNGDFDAPAPAVWGDYGGRSDARHGADFGGNWATLNDLTALDWRSATNENNKMYFRSYPCVSKGEGFSGTNAANIQTVGWGAASTYEHKSGWFGLGGKYQNIYAEKATAGKLFLGSYTNGVENHGVSIDKLPDALSFRYKYNIIKSTEMIAQIEIWSSSERIGVGEFKSDQIGDINHVERVKITYNSDVWNNGMLVKKPTQIRLWFSSKSTEATVNDVENDNGTYKSNNNTVLVWDARFFGSTLTVDDVELTYLQDITDSYTIK